MRENISSIGGRDVVLIITQQLFSIHFKLPPFVEIVRAMVSFQITPSLKLR